MPTTTGNLRHKSTVYKRAEPTFDVKNPPVQWVPVVENYYVEMHGGNTEQHDQTGHIAKVEVYTITGRYVDSIKPGMRIEARGKLLDITHCVDVDGDYAMLTMTGKVVA